MEKTRILIVAADPSAGMVPFVTTIANTLSHEKSYEVHALVVDVEDMSYSDKFCEDIKVTAVCKPVSFIGKSLFKIYPIRLVKTLKRIINEIKPDVIHFMAGEYLFANSIKKFPYKDAFCLTVHDLHPHERDNQSFKDGFIYKNIIFKGYKKCERFIPNITTSSLSQYKELKALYPSKNIVFTHFPSLVTGPIMNGMAKVEELLNVDKYILFFGSVDQYKGVDLLISAFSSLKNTNGVKLVIAGKGQEYETDDKRIIRLNRFIRDEEISDLFKRASFVVYPYISATMSGVLTIAYYFRKRVLLSDVQFFKDNAVPSCTFFHAGDKKDLCMKLQVMLNKPDAMFTEEFYEDIYSETTLIGDYLALYNTIINKAQVKII